VKQRKKWSTKFIRVEVVGYVDQVYLPLYAMAIKNNLIGGMELALATNSITMVIL
jgi:hypothetical protein